MSELTPRTVARNSAAAVAVGQRADLPAVVAGVARAQLTGREVTIPLLAVARELTGRDDAGHRQAGEAI